MKARATLGALAALLSVGCTENAILELQVYLPAAPATETWYAEVQVRPAASHPFTSAWSSEDDQVFALTDAPQWGCLSVEGREETDLHVRVRFCRSMNCVDDANPPNRMYRLEHPFYIGSRTYYRITDPDRDADMNPDPVAIPECATDADCAVGMCDTATARCGCTLDSECDSSGSWECVPDWGCAQQVGKCRIEGCIVGSSSSFCSLDEPDVHFCEQNPSVVREGEYMCGELLE